MSAKERLKKLNEFNEVQDSVSRLMHHRSWIFITGSLYPTRQKIRDFNMSLIEEVVNSVINISPFHWQIGISITVLLVTILGIKLNEVHMVRENLNEKVYDPLYKEVTAVIDYSYSVSDVYSEPFPYDPEQDIFYSNWENIKHTPESEEMSEDIKQLLNEYSECLQDFNDLIVKRKECPNDIFTGVGGEKEIKRWYAYIYCSIIMNDVENAEQLRQKMIKFAEQSNNRDLNDVHDWWLDDYSFQEDLYEYLVDEYDSPHSTNETPEMRFWELHRKQLDKFQRAQQKAKEIAEKLDSERKKPPLRFKSG